jgi:hypothetical protein
MRRVELKRNYKGGIVNDEIIRREEEILADEEE